MNVAPMDQFEIHVTPHKSVYYKHPIRSISVSTYTAYHQPTAYDFINHLVANLNLSIAVCDDIKTCLHEAVMNAIIHGNIGMKCNDTALKNFTHYLEAIRIAVENKEYGNKQINISAWVNESYITISVGDEGQGFSLSQPAANEQNPHGRGLMIIQELCSDVWLSPSNHLYMQFSRKRVSA